MKRPTRSVPGRGSATGHIPRTNRDNSSQLPEIGEVFNPYGMFNGVWIPDALARCSEITGSAKLLFGRLARYAGQDGRCFPALRTLAFEIGKSYRHVQKLVDELCEKKFLRKDARYRDNGSQTTNAYFFLFHCSLAPITAILGDEWARPQRRRRRGDVKNATPVADFAPGMPSTTPLEEKQLNSRIENNSSRLPRLRQKAAAVPPVTQFPKSTARFREFFPTTADSVIVRILQAISEPCPDATDQQIAAAVYVTRDQKGPGLWVSTMPHSVQLFIQRRTPIPQRVPECKICGDSGVVWDGSNKPAWCPAACGAAQTQRDKYPTFVGEWQTEFPEGPQIPLTTDGETSATLGQVEPRDGARS
jgi:GntR family transcriptional regulator